MNWAFKDINEGWSRDRCRLIGYGTGTNLMVNGDEKSHTAKRNK